MADQPASPTTTDLSRRGFLKNTSLGVAAATAVSSLPFVHAGEGPELEIKIGLIGCGGRGTGAALDAIGAATNVIYPESGYHTEDVAENARVERKNIKIVALADMFEDRLDRCRRQLDRLQLNVPDELCFVGIDAYKDVLAIPEINYVILATPPHFRPQHLLAAVQAGKHAFIEKPAAVDVPGVRTIMEAGRWRKRSRWASRRARSAGTCTVIARPSAGFMRGRSATSSTQSVTGTAARSGSSIARPAGATWNGSSATGITSPGCPAITSSNSTSTISTS